jgi:hypothetical protein
MTPSPTTDSCVGRGRSTQTAEHPTTCALRLPTRMQRSSVQRSISKSLLFCKKGLTATLSYTELCVENHSTNGPV